MLNYNKTFSNKLTASGISHLKTWHWKIPKPCLDSVIAKQSLSFEPSAPRTQNKIVYNLKDLMLLKSTGSRSLKKNTSVLKIETKQNKPEMLFINKNYETNCLIALKTT